MEKNLLSLALVCALTVQGCRASEPAVEKPTLSPRPIPTRVVSERNPNPIPVDPFLDPASPRYNRNWVLLPPGYSQVIARRRAPATVHISSRDRVVDPGRLGGPLNPGRPPRTVTDTSVQRTPERYEISVEACILSAQKVAERLMLECRVDHRSVPDHIYDSLHEGQVMSDALISQYPSRSSERFTTVRP